LPGAQRFGSAAAAALARLLLNFRAISGKTSLCASGGAADRLEPVLGIVAIELKICEKLLLVTSGLSLLDIGTYYDNNFVPSII
jgi:hypothetical protein